MNGPIADVLGQPLTDAGLVPVITIDRADDAGSLAAALLQGGIPYAEITFRTPAAAEAIERMRSEAPEMTVGAGTVLTLDQADHALRSGAQYVVSPALDAAVVDWCEEHSVPIIPGVATPTEVNAAWQRGLRTLKLFPAEQVGGVPLLRALRGPFPEVQFVPTGGITPRNLGDYTRQPNVVACGGSWVATREAISARKFDDIVAAAQDACTILRGARRQRSEAG
jgi:2-dehydro-3-deoxyphosphogluconate aldolase/(4S)-4-hydroxy-2-oxoglutarate aldolase